MEEYKRNPTVVEINHNGVKGWATEGFLKDVEKLYKKTERYWFFLWEPEHDIIRKERKHSQRDLKYCYIFVGKTQFLAWCDKNTNIVYKADGYGQTWIMWKHYIFIKFLTPMDL